MDTTPRWIASNQAKDHAEYVNDPNKWVNDEDESHAEN